MAASTKRPDGKVRVYNRHAALTAEPVQAQSGGWTVNLEVARRLPDSDRYDWEDRVILQVGLRELADVIATVLGWSDACEFTHHGPRRDKGYRFGVDADRLVLELFSGTGGRRLVALAAADRVALSALLFRQHQRNHGGLGSDVLLQMMRDVYASDRRTHDSLHDKRAR